MTAGVEFGVLCEVGIVAAGDLVDCGVVGEQAESVGMAGEVNGKRRRLLFACERREA